MKLPIYFYASIFILLFDINCKVIIAQNDSSEWKPGYFKLKDRKDTLVGFLKINMLSSRGNYFDFPENVSFRKNKDSKKETLKAGPDLGAILPEELTYFSFDNRKFNYFVYFDDNTPKKKIFQTYKGWIETIEIGAIDLRKGIPNYYNFGDFTLNAPPPGQTQSRVPMYYLEKKTNKDTSALLVSAPFVSKKLGYDINLYEIDEKNKQHFIEFISEDTELVERIKSKKLVFGEIEKIVSEYNRWAKNIYK